MKKAKKISLEKVVYAIMILSIIILGTYAIIHRVQEIREMNLSLFEFLFPTMRQKYQYYTKTSKQNLNRDVMNFLDGIDFYKSIIEYKY